MTADLVNNLKPKGLPNSATLPIGQVRQGDSLTGELWQVHRKPYHPAQQRE
jgi:hypothetical protein